MASDRHNRFRFTADRQAIPSGKDIELIQITTNTTTATRITFTNWVKKIILYNTSAEAAEIINLLAASDGTIGLPIQPSATPVEMDVVGEPSCNLWVKSASGSPVLTILGVY